MLARMWHGYTHSQVLSRRRLNISFSLGIEKKCENSELKHFPLQNHQYLVFLFMSSSFLTGDNTPHNNNIVGEKKIKIPNQKSKHLFISFVWGLGLPRGSGHSSRHNQASPTRPNLVALKSNPGSGVLTMEVHAWIQEMISIFTSPVPMDPALWTRWTRL